MTYLKRSGSDQTVALNSDVLVNIDLNQVFHLHNTTERKVTVVYKKLPKELISDVNSILEIDESDKVLGHELFQGGDKEVYNMSTDIFVVDTPFLIEKLEEEAAKEEPRKLRYVLRDLAVAENAFAYEYTGYLSNIHSVKAYFDANLDMLESQKFYSLFAPNQKVYTKVKNEEPTYYAASSDVKVSQFASGSLVRGKVDHSVVSRNVDLAEGSTVNHAVIFPRVEVGKNATVEYAIVDKGVKIADGVTIRGTENNPVVIKKGSVVTEDIVR